MGRLLLFLRLGSKWQDHINSLSDDLTFVAKMFDEHVLENFHAGFESVCFIITQSFANDNFFRLLRKNLNSKT